LINNWLWSLPITGVRIHLQSHLLADGLHAREVNLEILTGICAGLHRPSGQTIAGKMLFIAAAMAAEMGRDLIQERTLDGLAEAAAQGGSVKSSV
jgi:DNA invertase Pin-like site-specific DNA recombinase